MSNVFVYPIKISFDQLNLPESQKSSNELSFVGSFGTFDYLMIIIEIETV